MSEDPIRILGVGISAPPKAGAESIQFAKWIRGFKENGAIVDLVTTPVPARGWNRADKQLAAYLEDIDQIIEIADTGWTQRIMERFSGQAVPDRHYRFSRGTSQVVKQLKQPPAFIYARGMPFSSSLLGMQLARRLNVPLILHLADPFTLNPYLNFTANPTAEAMEEECFEQATLVAFTTSLTAELYAKAYPSLQNKFRIYPNVFEREQAAEITALPEKFTIRYTGNLYGERNLSAFLAAAERVAQEMPDFKTDTQVIISGRCDDAATQALRSTSAVDVRLEGALNYHDSLELQKYSHLLISTDRPMQSRRDLVFLPSKLLDYTCARRPILNISSMESESGKFVEENSLGGNFTHGDVEGIANYLKLSFTEYLKSHVDFFNRFSLPQGYDSYSRSRQLLHEMEQYI